MARVLFQAYIKEKKVHPSIRIISCVIFVIMLSSSSWWQLPVYSLGLLAMIMKVSGELLPAGFKLVYRIRWLLFSLMLASAWLIPGQPLAGLPEKWSPTYEGLIYGAHRVLVLVNIVIAVSFLINTTSTNQLVGGLVWILRPLKIAGLDTERLAVRIVLTLNEVKQPSVDLQALIKENNQSPPMERMSRAVTSIYTQFTTVDIEHAPGEIKIEETRSPPFLQWIWPLLLVLISLALSGVA